LIETLRKYPPLPILTRVCTKDYTVPNTTIKIKKGDMVGISTQALHNDPEYYPDPEKFDPERFSEENKKTRPDFTWIPFGEGPRLCIGEFLPKTSTVLKSFIGCRIAFRDASE
jgi:cytochrome P450 family 6